MCTLGDHEPAAPLRARGADDAKSVGPSELNTRDADPTAGTVNEKPLTRACFRALEQGAIGRRVRHVDGGALSE